MGFPPAVSRELKLSEKQETGIKQLKRQAKKSLIRGKADIEIIMIDVMAELHEKKVNREKIHSLIEMKYTAKKALTIKLVDAFVDLKELITESQWKTLKKLYHKKKKDKKSRGKH